MLLTLRMLCVRGFSTAYPKPRLVAVWRPAVASEMPTSCTGQEADCAAHAPGYNSTYILHCSRLKHHSADATLKFDEISIAVPLPATQNVLSG